MVNQFDPFNDRMARDIRNTLSTALVSQLADAANSTLIDDVARRWLRQSVAEVYHGYIRNRQQIYATTVDKIRQEGIQEPRFQALELWNAGLFFEMHELLETIWHGSRGDERIALKGLIQAGGVYVHRQQKNMKAARGLARRARENLSVAPSYLTFIRNLEQLVAHLETPDADPPMLRPGIWP